MTVLAYTREPRTATAIDLINLLIAYGYRIRRQAQPHVAIWLDCNGIEIWCGHFDEIRMNG